VGGGGGRAHARGGRGGGGGGSKNGRGGGPPGGEKPVPARRLPPPPPPLTLAEAIEVTSIHSVAGLLGDRSLIAERPVRAPHCTISDAALLGGGHPIRPGEITLAHLGVLFLDELPEFPPNVIA